MESQPQNPEIRINPENVHPCRQNYVKFDLPGQESDFATRF